VVVCQIFWPSKKGYPMNKFHVWALALCLGVGLAGMSAEAEAKTKKKMSGTSSAAKAKKSRSAKSKASFSQGSTEPTADRDRRLTRECRGRPNAGACEGYARP
jgi:hypothetical protein